MSVHDIQNCCDIAGLMYSEAGCYSEPYLAKYAVYIKNDELVATGYDNDREAAWNRAWYKYVEVTDDS